MKKIAILLSISLYFVNIFAQECSIQWQKSVGGNMYDYAKEIEHTSDGGYITVGYSGSNDGDVSFNHGGGDCWIVKSNATGIIQWEKTFGGTGYDYGYSIQQTTDGGYIIAAYTESTDGDIVTSYGGGDCWILKIDNSGTIEWERTYGGTLNDKGQSIKQTTDGGYIITGYTESMDVDVIGNHGGGDCWVLKINNIGIKEWQKTLGGSFYDFGQDIKQTDDGGYILTGGTNSNDGDVIGQHGNGDCWIVKLDISGNIIWQNSLGGTNYDYAQSIEQTNDGGYIMAGYSESSNDDITGAHGNGDCWIVKCDSLGNLQWQKALGSSGNDYAYCIKPITGGYILTGYSEINDGDVTFNHGNYDCWVVKLDESGIVKMKNSFGGTGVDIGYSICQITDGSYIVAGYSESIDGDVIGNHGGGDCWIIKLNLSSVGVQENIVENTISVSPNPSSGNFNFSGLSDGSTIDIYDISGKIILETKTGNDKYSIDLNGYAEGVYFYKITSKNVENKTGKIILN